LDGNIRIISVALKDITCAYISPAPFSMFVLGFEYNYKFIQKNQL